MRDPSSRLRGTWGAPGLSPPVEGWMGLKVQGGAIGTPCLGFLLLAALPHQGTLPQLSPVSRLAHSHQLTQAPPEP